MPFRLIRPDRFVRRTIAAFPDPFVLVPPQVRRATRQATRTVVGQTEPQRRLLAAVWATAAGDAMVTIAAPLLVLERGGGTAAAALVVPLLWLPYVLLGVPSGVIADRVSARRILAISIVAELAGMIALSAAVLSPGLALPLIYAGVLGVGIGRPVSDAAVGASIGHAYDEPALGGVAVSAANGGGRFVGLIGAGLTGAGGALPFALAAGAALCAVGLLFRIPGEPAAGEPLAFRRSLRRALQALRTPGVRGGVAIAIAWNLACAGPTAGLIAPLLRSEAGLTGPETAAVSALAGIVVFTASLIVARRMTVPDILRYGQRGVAGVGVACVAIGLAGLFLPAAPLSIVTVLAAATVPFATQPSIAIRLHAAPPSVRATTVAIGRAAVLGASFVGGVAWSFIAGEIGVANAMILSGSVTLLLWASDSLLFRPRLAELELRG